MWSYIKYVIKLINSLTPWSRVHFGKLIVHQRADKFPAFYGTPRDVTIFFTTCELS